MKKSKVTKIRKELKKVNTVKPKKNLTFKFLILIFILLILAGDMAYLIINHKLDVTKVTIKGNTKYKTEEISKKLNIKNRNIITLSISEIEEKLKVYPYIEKAITYKKIPNEIFITIEERKPKYYVLNETSNEIVILDKNGIALESMAKDIFTYEEPLIRGMLFPKKIKYGEKINEVEYSKIVAIDKILTEYTKQNIDRKITAIDFDSYKIILTLNDKLKVVMEETKELEYKIRFLKKILLEVDDAPGKIDMTLESPLYSK